MLLTSFQHFKIFVNAQNQDSCIPIPIMTGYHLPYDSKLFDRCVQDLTKYKCECNFQTDFKVQLKLHVNQAHILQSISSTPLYRCQSCNFETFSKFLFILHRKSNKCVRDVTKVTSEQLLTDKVKRFQCEYCHYKTEHKANLKKHVINKHSTSGKTQLFQCQHCLHKATSKSSLKLHVIFKHAVADEIEWFECDQCSYKGKTKKLLQTHLKSKHLSADEIKWFQCSHCQYKTKHKSHLLVHEINIHYLDKIKWLECAQCSYKAKTKSQLQQHFKSKHLPKDEIKQCRYLPCQYKTKCKNDLKIHENLKHADEIKWFECAQCTYKAKKRNDVRRHLKLMHLSADDNIKSSQNLKAPMRSMHTTPDKIKWFTCPQCPYKSKSGWNLKGHVKNSKAE